MNKPTSQLLGTGHGGGQHYQTKVKITTTENSTLLCLIVTHPNTFPITLLDLPRTPWHFRRAQTSCLRNVFSSPLNSLGHSSASDGLFVQQERPNMECGKQMPQCMAQMIPERVRRHEEHSRAIQKTLIAYGIDEFSTPRNDHVLQAFKSLEATRQSAITEYCKPPTPR